MPTLAGRLGGIPLVVLTNVGGVLVDAVLNDELVLESRISDNPIESGGVVSDHIVNLPVRINMTGRISDTPFTTQRVISEHFYAASDPPIPVVTGTFRTAAGFLAGSEATAGFNFLRSLRDRRVSFTVVTALGVFRDMVFQSLSVPRTSADGRSIRFTAQIRQLIIAESATVAATDVSGDVGHTAVDSSDVGLQPTSAFATAAAF